MTNIANSRVVIDIVMWFCLWPSEKPWAYQAGSHDDLKIECISQNNFIKKIMIQYKTKCNK